MSKLKNDKELNLFVGKKIRSLRLEKKLLQSDLAKKINKSSNTISNYENGLIAPSHDSLIKLAKVFDIKLDDFFPGPKNGTVYLDRYTELTTADMRVTDLKVMKDLLDCLDSLDDVDRTNLLNNIRFTVDQYNKFSKN